MRAVIVTGGSICNTDIINEYLTKYSILIACDSGLNYVYRAGLLPNVILGDFDSVDDGVLSYYKERVGEVFTYPVKKDYTDTELGIFEAEKRNCNEIVLLGATGTRLDHTIANVQLLYPLLKKGIRAKLVDEHNVIELVDSRLVIENKKGCYISLIPLTMRVGGIITKGLEYSLSNADIELGTSLTVSNVITDEVAEVSVKDGVLLSIIAKD
jgi:thiamine pyrophosphokinase